MELDREKVKRTRNKKPQHYQGMGMVEGMGCKSCKPRQRIEEFRYNVSEMVLFLLEGVALRGGTIRRGEVKIEELRRFKTTFWHLITKFLA